LKTQNLTDSAFLKIRRIRSNAWVETRIEHAAPYTTVYGIMSEWRSVTAMPRTAKVFMTNRSQAVRLPKEYQFSTDEVFIRKEGDDVILSARPRDWKAYLESAPVASDAFMSEVEDLPVQERER
jgi:antitoxin VapB